MSRFRSLWQASVNATKKALTWELEEMVPPAEKCIFKFSSKEDLKRWHLYSDSEYGGLSSASLEMKDGGNGSDCTEVTCMKMNVRGFLTLLPLFLSTIFTVYLLLCVFSGNLSTDMSEGSKWSINRSGFCGMRSKKFDGFIDLDGYDSIAMRLKGDGRCYISTVPLTRYLPTWKGNVIDADMEMNPGRVVGMSLSVNSQGGGFIGAKLGSGDFRVEIDWIKALRMP
uniref:NADH:ubiquinone oxidoreductase intermediate-associated protein 30 domain-containing protein n=1 Tax=Brassica campestris TaxID=3711 RepID=M4DHT2_BRACM